MEITITVKEYAELLKDSIRLEMIVALLEREKDNYGDYRPLRIAAGIAESEVQ